jgi:hypothetical protein
LTVKNRRSAHAAECAGDQHRLPGLRLSRDGYQLISRSRHEWLRRGGNRGEPLGNLRKQLGFDGAKFGIRVIGPGEHAVTDREPCDARPQGENGERIALQESIAGR